MERDFRFRCGFCVGVGELRCEDNCVRREAALLVSLTLSEVCGSPSLLLEALLSVNIMDILCHDEITFLSCHLQSLP